MPGADGKGTVKAFCRQRLAGKAPLLAMKRANNKAFPGNGCKGKRLSRAMVAKAKGSVGHRYKGKRENKSTFAEMLSPLHAGGGVLSL